MKVTKVIHWVFRIFLIRQSSTPGPRTTSLPGLAGGWENVTYGKHALNLYDLVTEKDKRALDRVWGGRKTKGIGSLSFLQEDGITMPLSVFLT